MDWSAGRRWWQLMTRMGLLAICSYYCVSIFSFCSVLEALNMEYTRIPQGLPDRFLKIWLFSFIRQQGVHKESTGTPAKLLEYRELWFYFIRQQGVHMESTGSSHGVHMESTWSPVPFCHFLLFYLEFTWSPPGVHLESTWSPWSLPGVYLNMWGSVKYWCLFNCCQRWPVSNSS